MLWGIWHPIVLVWQRVKSEGPGILGGSPVNFYTRSATMNAVIYKIGPLSFEFKDNTVSIRKWDSVNSLLFYTSFDLTPEETERAREDLREVIKCQKD